MFQTVTIGRTRRAEGPRLSISFGTYGEKHKRRLDVTEHRKIIQRIGLEEEIEYSSGVKEKREKQKKMSECSEAGFMWWGGGGKERERLGEFDIDSSSPTL